METAAKTWAGEWWKLGGGGNVWDGITYDPELNMVYIGIGQGGPWVARLSRSHDQGQSLSSAPSSL